jgi:hypothetical protein
MDTACKTLCDTLARNIVARDFTGAHALLAPWLRTTMKPSDIERMVTEAGAGLPVARGWTLDEGFLELKDLRKPDPYGPPSQAVSNEVSAQNYRGWLCIQFTPGGGEDDEANICFDLWIAAVEQNGACAVGYLEAAEPS